MSNKNPEPSKVIGFYSQDITACNLTKKALLKIFRRGSEEFDCTLVVGCLSQLNEDNVTTSSSVSDMIMKLPVQSDPVEDYQEGENCVLLIPILIWQMFL